MADRESLLREAQRKQRARLAERTSPDYDGTPALEAWFDAAPQPLDAAVDRFVPLLQSLTGQNPFIESWRVVRSAADHEAATGLDVVANPRAFADFLSAQRNAETDGYSFSVLGFSTQIFPDDPRTYSAQIGYTGTGTGTGSDRVTFLTTSQRTGDTLSFAQWVRMIETLVQWRTARYVSVGPYGYAAYGRVHRHRMWQGWIGWFAQVIDPAGLPDFAIVQRLGCDTLVASQDRSVRSDDRDAVARAKDLEIALAELGVLPTQGALG